MKIALSGYYGFDNAGDEALLAAIPAAIKKQRPDVEFVAFSGAPSRTCQVHGIPAVHYLNPLQVIGQIQQADLLISGGGSIFQDVTSGRSLPYYISIVALARLMKKPVIFYAQGVGPITRPLSKFLMRLVANRVNLITLRDESSRQLLLDLGVDRPPLIVTADPVFFLEPRAQDNQAMGEFLNGLGAAGPAAVGVAVRQWSTLEKYQDQLAHLLDELAIGGHQIIFIPMAYPDDVDASRRVMELMNQPSVLVDRHLSSQEHLALIEHLDLVIGMRLHALIFAANRGVPFAGISYDPKIDAFLKTFKFSPLSDNYTAMKKQVEDLLNNSTLHDQLKQHSAHLREKAEETAHLALSLIDDIQPPHGNISQ